MSVTIVHSDSLEACQPKVKSQDNGIEEHAHVEYYLRKAIIEQKRSTDSDATSTWLKLCR